MHSEYIGMLHGEGIEDPDGFLLGHRVDNAAVEASAELDEFLGGTFPIVCTCDCLGDYAC